MPITTQLRKKLTLFSVIVYWPVIFFLTHTPLPKVVYQANLSDKSLHFMVYFILVFLLWGTIRPYSKVTWDKPPVWIILAVIVWYGVMDEWLQGYVQGRTADVHDFLADLAGSLTSLALLSILSFWPALLAMSAMVSIVVVNSYRADISHILPITSALIAPLIFTFFTGLTFYCVHTSKINLFNTKKRHSKWLIPILFPGGLLVVAKVGALLLHRHLVLKEVVISCIAIILTTLIGHNAQKLLKIIRK